MMRSLRRTFLGKRCVDRSGDLSFATHVDVCRPEIVCAPPTHTQLWTYDPNNRRMLRTHSRPSYGTGILSRTSRADPSSEPSVEPCPKPNLGPSQAQPCRQRNAASPSACNTYTPHGLATVRSRNVRTHAAVRSCPQRRPNATRHTNHESSIGPPRGCNPDQLFVQTSIPHASRTQQRSLLHCAATLLHPRLIN